MLKTNDDIYDEIKQWLQSTNKEITFFSPFISEFIIEDLNRCIPVSVQKRLLVRLQSMDILTGVTSLSSIRKSIQLGFEVRYNFQLHAKVIWNERAECFFGSANLTSKGLGLGSNPNFEEVSFSNNSLSFLSNAEKFWRCSTIVDVNMLDLLEKYYQDNKIKINVKDLETYPLDAAQENGAFFEDKKFNLLQIPLSKSINELHSKIENKLIDQAVQHDMRLFTLDFNTSIDEIRKNSLNSKLIKSFLDFNGEGKRFGELRTWLENNIEDVPSPSRTDLNTSLNHLFDFVLSSYPELYFDQKFNHTHCLKKRLR